MTLYTLVTEDQAEVYIEAASMEYEGNWIVFYNDNDDEFARYRGDVHVAVITGPQPPIAWRNADELDRVEVKIPRSDIDAARTLRRLIEARNGNVPTWVDELADMADA